MAEIKYASIDLETYIRCIMSLPDPEKYTKDEMRISVKRSKAMERPIANPSRTGKQVTQAKVILWDNEFAVFHRLYEDGYWRWRLDSKNEVVIRGFHIKGELNGRDTD